MTPEATVAAAMDATTATVTADEAIRRVRHTVDELHDVAASAVRVLQEAEFDSAKSRLSDRGDYYTEMAADHLGRVQNRVIGMRELSDDLGHHLERAAGAVAEAHDRVVELSENARPDDAQDLAYLRQRLAVLGEMVDLARPLAHHVAEHVEAAGRESREVTAASLLEPRSLEHSIRTTTQEMGRADEDLRVLEDVVERASLSARQSADVATEISENAYERMSQHRDRPHPPSSPGIGPGTPPR